MIDLDCVREDFSPIKKTVDYVKYKIDFMKQHPDYFYPDGLVVFVGPQGSGKTLSAVNYVNNIMNKFPLCKLICNILLKDFPIVTFEDFLFTKYGFDEEKMRNVLNNNSEYDLDSLRDEYMHENRVFAFDDADDIERYSNGEYGVLYLIDEISLYFNSLESKNINMEVMVQFAQQRKQRKHIVCTSQVFGRLAKPLREQFNCVVSCFSYCGFVQCNKVIDRDSLDEGKTDDMHIEGTVKKKYWFVHSPSYYKRYDTYYLVSRNKFVSEEKKVRDIYDTTTIELPSNS